MQKMTGTKGKRGKVVGKVFVKGRATSDILTSKVIVDCKKKKGEGSALIPSDEVLVKHTGGR